MSNPNLDGSQSGMFRRNLDSATKILAIVLAFVGGIKYFYDKHEELSDNRAEKSIGYIETYAGAELLAAREVVYDFWIGQKELIGVLRQENISFRNYEALVEQTIIRIGADAVIQNSLLIFDNFYAQIDFCKSAELCDKTLLDKYFCETAVRDARAYAIFYARLRRKTGDNSLGTGLTRYVKNCIHENVRLKD